MASYSPEEMEMVNLGEDPTLPDDLDYDLEYLVRRRNKDITIRRNLLNEAEFEKGFHPVKSSMRKNWRQQLVPPEPIKSSLLPPMSKKAWINFLFTHVPIISWIWSYQTKFFLHDVIAGLTVAIMHIPQGLAYGQLASLPAVYGLYCSFTPVIIYSLLGTSRHVSIGTFAVVCLMVSNAIENVLLTDPDTYSPCLNTSLTETDPYISSVGANCSEIRLHIAVAVAMLSGIMMLVMGFFQLGFITIFLSESLVSGYTTGAAVHVFTSQLRHIFGLSLDRQRGIFSVPKTWVDALSKIAKWPDYVNTATVIIAFVSIFMLIVFRIVDRRVLRKIKIPCFCFSRLQGRCVLWKKLRWAFPLPSQLIVVGLAACVSFAVGFKDRYGVDIVDTIPSGPPAFSLPQPSLMVLVIQDAFVLSVVTYAITISLAQVFANQFKYSINSNQEFIAYGAMNIVGSLFSSFNAAGSLSRSTVQAVSGGKTQLVGLISSAIILVVLLALGFLFEPLPNAVLASIIWVALYGMLSQVLDVWNYFKLSIPDMLIWIVVFLATVLLGIDLGLAMGVAFSLCMVLFRNVLPHSSVLGRAEDTELYRNSQNFIKIKEIPGVVIFRFQGPVCYINSKVFVARLRMACKVDPLNVQEEPGCLKVLFYRLFKKGRKYEVSVDSGSVHFPERDLEEGNGDGIKRSKSFQKALSKDVVDEIATEQNRVHTLVLDCAPIGFMDAVGVRTLMQLVAEFDSCGIQVLYAAMTKENRDMLERVGFFEKYGKEWLFPSIQDAVNHSMLGQKLRPMDKEEEQMVRTSTLNDNNNNGSVTVSNHPHQSDREGHLPNRDRQNRPMNVSKIPNEMLDVSHDEDSHNEES